MISTWLDLFVALSPLVSGVAGYLLGGAAARRQIGKREAYCDGLMNPPHDFSWPGRPMRIIEAEIIETAVRGD